MMLKDKFWASALTLLFFSSPDLAFYGVSFITDAPALCFTLIGYCALMKYYTLRLNKYLWLALVLIALAGLLKISSLIGFLFLAGIFVLEGVFGFKTLKNKAVFTGSRPEWGAFILVVLSILSWYYYAHIFNRIHAFKYTFNDIWPIWDIDKSSNFVRALQNHTVPLFYSRSVLFPLLFVAIFNLFQFKKIPLFPYLCNLIVMIGAACYVVLWGASLANHDYYFIALLVLFPGILYPFFFNLNQNFKSILASKQVKLLMTIVLIYNLMYCFEFMQLRSGSKKGFFLFINNEEVVCYLKFFNNDYQSNLSRYPEISDQLIDLGIQQEDKVISFPDKSFNTSLVLLGRKGWTNFKEYSTEEDIYKLISKGAKYLFIGDPNLLNQDFIQPFIHEEILDHKGLKVFKLPTKRL